MVTATVDHTTKIKVVSKQANVEWVVNAWKKMRGRKELITKSFQIPKIQV